MKQMFSIAKRRFKCKQEFPKNDVTSYRGPEALDLEEDIDDAAVSDERHDPEEEEDDAEEVGDQRVHRRELAPVRVDDCHDVLCEKY